MIEDLLESPIHHVGLFLPPLLLCHFHAHPGLFELLLLPIELIKHHSLRLLAPDLQGLKLVGVLIHADDIALVLNK